MKPAQAIRTGFAKSFQYSGRASRSEFWWFAPVALLPPVALGSQLSFSKVEIFGIWRLFAVMLACLPLLAGMARRLQDMGEPGQTAFMPFTPLIVLWMAYMSILGVGFALAAVGGGGLTIALWIVALILLIPLHIFFFFASIFAASSTIGMMLVASDLGPNRYGPNPSKVTP